MLSLGRVDIIPSCREPRNRALSHTAKQIPRLAANYERRAYHLDRQSRYRQPGASLRDGQSRSYIGVMHLNLTDEEAAALTQELHDIIESDHYPFSPRIRTLRAILAKLSPEPVREPLPVPKVYAPPRATLEGLQVCPNGD
jgi:hypothetical protein